MVCIRISIHTGNRIFALTPPYRIHHYVPHLPSKMFVAQDSSDEQMRVLLKSKE